MTPPYDSSAATDALVLYRTNFSTPLGDMIAVADDAALHLLEFSDQKGLPQNLEKMQRSGNVIEDRTNTVLEHLEKELAAYLAGSLKEFKTPLYVRGGDFQKSVMRILQSIPYGQTMSYAQQAKALCNPKAVRAVGRANGMNQIAIIIPCHRVIGSDGSLTGYAGGIERKKWLLAHEANFAQGF